ncbi:NUC141 domain-containing protein [Mrakia frigida]|uniref:Utp7p n=1 Tax=Mrakia frigida TaxID=29902 RepID=UPI003FCC1194
MDALLASATTPLASSSKRSSSYSNTNKRKAGGGGKGKGKSEDGGDKQEKVDSVVHSIGASTRAPKSHHTQDDFRPPNMSHVKDLKLRSKLSAVALADKRAEKAKLDSELLLPSLPGLMQATSALERTYKVTQSEIQDAAGLATASKGFDLKLDGGGVVARWSKEGRHLAMATRQGHISTMNFQSSKLQSEIFVNETVRDITFLHTTAFHAVAQKKYIFIYDQDGTELHKLKDHVEPTALGFLPYHYLLVSTSQSGYLKYQDTSTGQLIKEQRTRLGGCNVLEVNGQSGIVHLGHQNGTMTLWSPNLATPHVRLLAHLGPITSISIDPSSSSLGRHLCTTGLDGAVKIWDSRNYSKPLSQWTSRREIASTAFSQRGLLAVGAGSTVQIYDGVTRGGNKGAGPFGPSPYLTNLLPGKQIKDVKFCPFEDVLGVGHSEGFTTLLVPGSGEPNFDSGEGDMFESAKRRREREVREVMEKIQPDLITMDPTSIGGLAPGRRVSNHVVPGTKATPFSKLPRIERLRANDALEDPPEEDDGMDDKDEDESKATTPEEKEKMRMRGRGKTLKRFLRKKKKNVIDPATVAIKEKLKAEREKKERARNPKAGDDETGALSRFGRRHE